MSKFQSPISRLFALDRKFLNLFCFLLVLTFLSCTANAERPSKRLLSRFLSSSNTRCMAEIDSDQLIGSYNAKVLDINPFNINMTDTWNVNCFYNQTCFAAQNFDFGGFSYTPRTINFTASKLPGVWKCLGTTKVLIADNLDLVADSVNDLVLNLTDIFTDILSFREQLIVEINQFLIDFNTSTTGLSQQAIQKIIVELNNTNSDLALEFEQILANAFNIFIGRYLQQVANDFLYFNNKLQNVVQVVNGDIQTNEAALVSANQSLVEENIQKLTSQYSDMAAAFVAEFAKYQQVEDNFTDIISDLLNTQIVQKFNFSDNNVTLAVRGFLWNIIQNKRNLVNNTKSLFTTQFEKYKSDLNNMVANQSAELNSSLAQLQALLGISGNSNNSSNAGNSSNTSNSSNSNNSNISGISGNSSNSNDTSNSSNSSNSNNTNISGISGNSSNSSNASNSSNSSNTSNASNSSNSNSSSNSFQSVNSLFTNSSKIHALLVWNKTINALQSLNDIATAAFADALNQFQTLFTEFVSNLEEIQTAVNSTFDGNYTLLTSKVEEFIVQITSICDLKLQQIWIDVVTIVNLLTNSLKNVLNTDYVLSNAEQKRLTQFNFFEVNFANVLEKLVKLKILINSTITNLTQEIEQSNALIINSTGLNTSIVTTQIIQNLTLIINKTTIENLAIQLKIDQNLAQAESLLGIGSGASSVNVTEFLTDLYDFALVHLNQQFEIIKAIVRNNFTNLTTFEANESAILESRFSNCGTDSSNKLQGLPAHFAENKTFVLTNFSQHDIINQLIYQFNFSMDLNGSYGAVRNELGAAIFFELSPEISISIDFEERLREFSFLRFNGSTNASGSGNISNVLSLALILLTDDEFVESSIVRTNLSEFSANIETRQQFISVNTTESCDNVTKVCQNDTTYGWDDAIVNKKNVSVPKQDITSYVLVKNVNISELLN